MGTKDDWWKPKEGSQAIAPALPPVTRERIELVFQRNDWKFGEDDDGDLIASWDDAPFWFVLAGEDKEILQILCRCPRDFDPSQVSTLQRGVLEWNRDKIWPKAYYRPHPDSGKLAVFGEHTIDHEVGCTDDQLELHIRCAIGTGLDLCKHFAALDTD